MKDLPYSLSISQVLCLCACLAAAQAHAQEPSGKKEAPAAPKPQSIKVAMRDGLRFDPPRFEGKPGADVVINLENLDSTDQMHNFVLIKPGKREAVVTAALQLADKGPALQFVPPGSDVLAASKLLAPEKKDSLRLTLPKEPGVYPFVCTFPGHGLVMYGAAYVGVKMPSIKQDKNIPATAVQTYIPGAGRRPFVQRIFMPDSGPAAIAVALPGDLNACWDAGACRLRYVWKGEFIDATQNWAGNGKTLPQIGGTRWWTASAAAPGMRFGAADAAPPAVKFLGYTLEKGFPVFRYRLGEVEVTERLAVDDKGRVIRDCKLSGVTQDVFVDTGTGEAAAWRCDSGKPGPGVIHLSKDEAAAFVLVLEALKK